jgi:hypothetical protein
MRTYQLSSIEEGLDRILRESKHIRGTHILLSVKKGSNYDTERI